MTTNFDIIRTARAILHVTDLDKSEAFYTKGLGLIVTERTEDAIYLRGLEEHIHHSLVLKKAETPVVEAISYKVRSDDDLEKIATVFEKHNLKVKWLEAGTQHAVGRALRVQDISGLPVEFFAKMEGAERLLQRYDLYQGAKAQRIDHFNCMVPDVEKAYDFYINELDFSCSEFTTDDEDRIWAAWIHRKPSVHDVAFMNGEGPRVHHVAYWLSDPMSLIHGCDVLASLGYAENIERGPARHGLSNAFFLYLRDPDGHRIELYNGDYLTSDPDFNPIRWDLNDKRRQTFWGAEAPDCWFSEASKVIDIETNETISTTQGKLKQAKPIFAI
ncbi:MAG TPA: 3,4-dihydroxyphenylacetate 2,3-dioxygenase [Rummeliibacillus sp.]|nr:3,4-dihydroxyphenylacetate 2,3-dioxygenase [Rummeliibacillus sp.]